MTRRSPVSILLAALAAGLAVAIVLLAREVRRLRAERETAENAVIPQLVRAEQGGWDSHPDPDVARVLQPNLDGALGVKSNRFGLREREFEVPKPEGVVRVVLLGDSFVYGYSVEAEQRLGAHLEQWLEQNARRTGVRLQVLHIGVGSWNLRSECAWMLRALSLVQPDLVVHFAMSNDLDDTVGARGFGAMANFSPQHPDRVHGIVDGELPIRLGGKESGWLRHGFDHESRTRFSEARAQIDELERAVLASGAQYVLVLNWIGAPHAAYEHFATGRDPARTLALPASFASDARYRISDTDAHWSVEGHRTVASLLYGAITARGLLPALDPAPLEEHTREFEALDAQGQRDARATTVDAELAKRLGRFQSRIELPPGASSALDQVHAGVDKQGQIAPYFSAFLATAGGSVLHIRGADLGRPELAGVAVAVEVDEVRLGGFELKAQGEHDLSFELPPEVRARPVLTVRLVAEDYVYLRDLRRGGVLVLEELAIE